MSRLVLVDPDQWPTDLRGRTCGKETESQRQTRD
jgi:hypothetical protein